MVHPRTSSTFSHIGQFHYSMRSGARATGGALWLLPRPLVEGEKKNQGGGPMGRKRKKRINRSHPPGTLPGTLVAHAEADAVPVQIFLFSYGPDRCEERALRPEEIPSLAVPA